MKLTHFGFDAKYLQINKINKKENQTNPINSVKNSIIADKFVIPNCTLLQAYNNMLSFKGDTPTLSLQNKHKSNFGRFNDNKAWDYFKNTLCANYTEKEIDNLLNAISSKNSEDKDACKKFLSLININSVENITYSDKIQDEKTKKTKTITLQRALTPIEAKELIVNGLTKNSDIERYFKLADDDGFESDIAIASIKYSLDSKDRIRLEWLSNELFENNRKLSQEEAIVCIAYGFNETEQVQSFINRLEKEYRGNKLDLFEAALCTIHNLDDSRTEQFFELKSKQIPYPKEDGEEDTYTLSTQEAVLCAKAELDEDELKRYAELKNKPFMYTAVREHNSPKAPSTELIIAYIKDKQSDEEIAELAKLGLKNSQEYDDYKEILLALNYDLIDEDDEIKTVISYLATLKDENGKNIFKDKEGKFDFKEFNISSLTDIARLKLTPIQVEYMSEILTELMKIENPYFADIHYISACLAKLQDNNGENIFKDTNKKYNFKNFQLNELEIIGEEKLTKAQFDDYLQILPILKSKFEETDIGLLVILSCLLSKLQDNNGKNLFKDEDNNFNFDNYDIHSLYALGNCRFSNFSQIKDFPIILSILQTMDKPSRIDLYSLAADLAKLQNENGKNIFKDEKNNFDFKNLSFKDLIDISQYNFTQEQIIEYHNICSILKTKPQIDPYHVSFLASGIVNLPEEVKQSLQDKQGNFDFDDFDVELLSRIIYHKLSPSELRDALEISTILKYAQLWKIKDADFLSDKIAKLPNEIKDTLKDNNGNFNLSSFHYTTIETLSNYNEKHCQNYLELISLGLTPEKAIHIATNEDLMQRFKLVDPNIFWQGATGESKEVFELFNSLLDSNDIMGNRLQEKDFDINLPEDCSFKFGTLRYSPTDSNQQGFNVELQKASKNLKPIMIVKNKNSENESYIAYDGAIALFKELRALTQNEAGILQEDLSSHSHFSEEEINALSEAARHFIIDILEENGECIISKGIEGITKPFEGKELDTTTTKEKFKEILQKLHNDIYSPNVSIENILRLIPKDSTIQIRPYATSSKSTHEILYSISAEWKDKNGREWQLRVHSHDLKFLDNGKSWIYRLGYKDATSAEQLFYDNNQNDFVAGSSNPITHIKINEEAETYENKLISNPYFQKTIREISISFNKTQLIDAVAKELSINKDNKSKDEIGTEIIQKCQRNAGYYYKYKKVIDTLLNEQGLPALDKAA